MGYLPTDLLEAIDRLGFQGWSGQTYRHTSPNRNPLSGAGARMFGGRWNPPELVSTIYLASPRAACIGEFHRMAAGQAAGPTSFLPRTIHHIQVHDLPVLNLTGDRLSDVDLTLDDIADDDWSSCQVVGEAAHFLGGAGVVAASATGLGLTIAVFETRVHGHLELVGAEEIGEDEVGDLVPPHADSA